MDTFKGKVFTLLGLCAHSKCSRRGYFDVIIDLGNKTLKRKLCPDHAAEFIDKNYENISYIRMDEWEPE